MKEFFRKYWRIVLIVVIILLSFAIPVYWFMKPSPELGENPNVADYIFDFLDKWASAGGPVFTLLLALAAFWAIWQTRGIQKSEKRERLLNEILEWAVEAAESAISRQTRIPSELWKAKLKYKHSQAKSKYIAEVAYSSFDSLSPFITNVAVKLEKAVEVSTQVIEHKANGKALVNSERELTESVEKLITELAKIKARDIG